MSNPVPDFATASKIEIYHFIFLFIASKAHHVITECAHTHTHSYTHRPFRHTAKLSNISPTFSSFSQLLCTIVKSHSRVTCSGWTSRLLPGAFLEKKRFKGKRKQKQDPKKKKNQNRILWFKQQKKSVSFLCWILSTAPVVETHGLGGVVGSRGRGSDPLCHLYHGQKPAGKKAMQNSVHLFRIAYLVHLTTPVA